MFTRKLKTACTRTALAAALGLGALISPHADPAPAGLAGMVASATSVPAVYAAASEGEAPAAQSAARQAGAGAAAADRCDA
jgi:hypothetical protein